MQDEFACDPLVPPSLQHQRASSWASHSHDESPPVNRSFAVAIGGEHSLSSGFYGPVSESGYSESYEEPVYRSISAFLHEPEPCVAVHGEGGGYGVAPVGCAQSQPEPMCAAETCAMPPAAPQQSQLEVPREVFGIILSFLPSHPWLFNAMAVSRAWCDEARAVYERRTARIPPRPDALLQAVLAATPGDTLLLEAGLHDLSSEVLVDKPLRLGPVAVGAHVVLTTRCHALLRTRASVVLNGLTFCRMGEAEGHPNAVIVADSGTLLVEHCRVTCGGPAPTVEQALRVFDGAPAPGGTWQQLPTAALPPTGDDGAAATRQGPQSGVWVGSSATVTLRHNTISCCSGPGVKIYRGRLLAESNTIAFSRCGANVVANSGRVTLARNAIHNARGDGVSSWNNCHIQLEANTIGSNSGTGFTINTGGGSVTVVRNIFLDNALTAIQFATSNVRKVTIGAGEQANDFSRNEAGGVHGLSQRTSSSSDGWWPLGESSSGSPSAPPPALPDAFPMAPMAPPMPRRIPTGHGRAGSPPERSSMGSWAPTASMSGATSRERATSDEPMDIDTSSVSAEGSVHCSGVSCRSGWSVEMG